MPERWSKDAQDKICSINIWDIPEKCLRYFLYLCQIYGQDKAEKCLKYAYDMPEISVRNGWNKPLICLR